MKLSKDKPITKGKEYNRASTRVKKSGNSTKERKNKTKSNKNVPIKNNKSWPKEQDEFLLQLVREHGRKWTPINRVLTQRFPGFKRTANGVRKHWRQTLSGSDIKLNDEEKRVFLKSVQDVKDHKLEFLKTVTWRYNEIKGKSHQPIQVNGARKLLKVCKSWTFKDDVTIGNSSSQDVETEMESEKAEIDNDLANPILNTQQTEFEDNNIIEADEGLGSSMPSSQQDIETEEKFNTGISEGAEFDEGVAIMSEENNNMFSFDYLWSAIASSYEGGEQ